MAAMLMQPWPPFLPHLTLVFLTLILFFPNQSFSQSDSPRNIETFFPNDTITPPVQSPVLSPPQNPSSSSSDSDRGNILRAVLITAASTLLVAAVFFFLVHKCRRRRNRVGGVDNTLQPPVPPLAEAALAREGFTRFGGNVKGLILDENGLDVLYWRKLQQSQRDNKGGSFRKEIIHGDDEEKNVIYSKSKKKSGPVTETPLLRGRSSTSHSVIHNDNYRNATTTHPPHVKTDSFEFVKPDPTPPPPPPPPIPVKQSATPPPPPPPKLKNNGPSPPPPPPLKKTAALSSSASKKPPPAPRGSSSGESSNGQVKLKPLHWDKVNPDSDHSMVWDKIDRGSFR